MGGPWVSARKRLGLGIRGAGSPRAGICLPEATAPVGWCVPPAVARKEKLIEIVTPLLRTSDGYEIDLIVDIEGERWPSRSTDDRADTDDVARLGQTAKLVDATRIALVCRKHIGGQGSRVLVTDLDHLLEAI